MSQLALNNDNAGFLRMFCLLVSFRFAGFAAFRMFCFSGLFVVSGSQKHLSFVWPHLNNWIKLESLVNPVELILIQS